MLAVEAADVVVLRLMKLSAGGFDVLAETELMVSEKMVAFCGTALGLCVGATPAMVVTHYRRCVAANAARLGTARKTR